MDYFTLLMTLTPVAGISAAVVRVKSRRRRRGRHVRRGYGRHERRCGSDLVPRVLSALARVDVWILS